MHAVLLLTDFLNPLKFLFLHIFFPLKNVGDKNEESFGCESATLLFLLSPFLLGNVGVCGTWWLKY